MEVSPKTFREVEFREKMRGYHPEDVDQFLEQMAAGIEVMQERLRQALDRAQRAEQVAAEAGNSDETLKRTLVLAQRTADMAVQESRDQASRILASAEQQAQSLVAEAEDRARRLHGEALADVHAELAKLEAIRAQAQQEVDTLSRWAEEHRTHLSTTLQDALAMVDRAGVLTPPPTSSPIDVPFAARRASPAPHVALPPVPAAESGTGAPPPRSLDEETRAVSMDPPPAAGHGEGPRPDSRPSEPRTGETQAVAAVDGDDPADVEAHEDAIDSYFEDNDFGDDRRFGGRLRRRR